MPVATAEDGMRVEADHVYVPPPGVVVNFHHGCLHLIRLEPGEPREFNPITIPFNSFAASLGGDAIGIVLSGTGSNGSLGLKAIKENGGVTFVQGANGTPPQHDGMPASAIAIGAADVIAAVEDLPARLIASQEGRRNPDMLKPLEAQELEAARLAICDILSREVGHDFSLYKDKTVIRRVHVLGLT
jgi:two-component system CheB/CheR fusion protein